MSATEYCLKCSMEKELYGDTRYCPDCDYLPLPEPPIRTRDGWSAEIRQKIYCADRLTLTDRHSQRFAGAVSYVRAVEDRDPDSIYTVNQKTQHHILSWKVVR